MGLLRDLGKKVVSRLSERGPAAPTAPTPRPPAPPARPPVSVPVPPPAAEPSVEGFPEECRPASLAALARALGPGPRLRVVNHWATWCEPCVDEIPLLVAIHLQLEDRADFLGICWERFDDDRPLDEIAVHVADFASVRAIRYPSLLVTDPPERFFEAMKLSWRKIPQTWLVAPDGSVLLRIEGALTEESAADLVARIEAM